MQIRERLAPNFHRLGASDQKFEQQVDRVIPALRADGREPTPAPRL
jgi:hypothetical protein